MALSVADLNNAKLDTDHLAELVTSTDATSTDRLGQVKKTWSGIVDELEAEAAITETWQNAQDADTARILAEGARDASMVTADVSTDYTTAFAATAIGSQFTVAYTDGRIVRYKKLDAVNAATQATYYSAGAVDAIVNPPVDLATYTAPLLVGHAQGMVLDGMIANRALAVQVKDGVTPANNFLGSAVGFGNINYITPKLCMLLDGTYRFQPHNDAIRSDDFTSGSWSKTNVTPGTLVSGPDGATADLTTFTVTGVALPVVTQNVTVRANEWRTHSFTIKKGGTSPFQTVSVTDNAVTKRASINMATLALGTVDAGITAVISNTDENGVVYRDQNVRTVLLTYKTVATSIVLRVAPSNTDHGSGTNSVIGHTFIAGRATSYRGARRLKYMRTTTAVVRDEPLDWTHLGEQMIRSDVQMTYAGREADNLTNATFWTWNPAQITPALDAVGPHNEPCSSITAITALAVITQAVTSSGTSQNFHACLRRRTGSGTLEMTKDNGATWTDVTALVGPAGGRWGRAFVRGAVANPTIGFRVGTPGDVFEVSMANVSKSWQLPPPYPSTLIDYTTSLDAFNVPNTKYNAAGTLTMYADFYIPPDAIGTAGARSRVGFLGAALAPMSTVDINVLATQVRFEHTSNDGTLRTQNFGASVGGRIQIQHRVKASDYASAYDDNASWWNHNPGVVPHTGVGFTMAQSIWIRRLLVVPEDISSDNDALRKFKLEAAPNNNVNLLAHAMVAKGVPGSGGHLRIPSVERLYVRNGDICGFGTYWGQRNTIGYNAEHPQRAMSRRWEFDRSTNILTPMTGELIDYQPAGWATGEWGVQGYNAIKISRGPFRGRLGKQYEQQDMPNGVPDRRQMYWSYSDDNGNTWSPLVQIMSLADVGLVDGFVINGENSTIFQLQEGPHAGRVYSSLNVTNNRHGVMWTDDYTDTGDGTGANWDRTPDVGMVLAAGWPFGTQVEPAVSYFPDGRILLTFRNSGGGDNGYSISTDYGMSFSPITLMGGDNVSWNVNVGLLQDDPSGMLYGRLGRLIYARSTLNGRTGHKVQQSLTDPPAWGNNYRLFSAERFIGYSPIKKAFDDDNIYICMAEHQPNGLTNIDTSQMVAVFRY